MKTERTAKEQVKDMRPGAWACDCGCGGIYDDDGNLLGSGPSKEEAWDKALELLLEAE